MSKNPVIALPYDDYAQSANTLFHFMSKSEYLKSILMNRAIVPRYCLENIEYLNIHIGDTYFKEVAILPEMKRQWRKVLDEVIVPLTDELR